MLTTKQVPSVEISAEAFEDEDTGRISIAPKIRAYTQGYSMGTIALDDFEDLYLVKESIERFIKLNNINNAYAMDKENSEEKEAPAYTALIETYLWSLGVEPMTRATFNPQTMQMKTSQDIIIDMADMVDLTLNDVAAAMLHLGYVTCWHEGRCGWLLRTQKHKD